MKNTVTVRGNLVKGYRVASQPSRDYPEYGTIEKQKPIFKELGFNDIDKVYNGTLNILIFPKTFEVLKPKITFRDVEWTNLHPRETFSFSKCVITFNDVQYNGWVYYPYPETKKRHFQNPFLIEILAEKIPDIKYGNKVGIRFDRDEISINSPSLIFILRHITILFKYLKYMFDF